MSFILDDTYYVTARKHLLTVKTENIIEIMRNLLNLMKINIKKAQTHMKKQIDKYHTNVNYIIENRVYLFTKYIIIDRSSYKLKNKMINLYSIMQKMSAAY